MRPVAGVLPVAGLLVLAGCGGCGIPLGPGKSWLIDGGRTCP